MKRNVILTGASGMVGSLILELCLESDDVNTVTSLVRRPSSTVHPKLREIVVEDFSNYDPVIDEFENQDIAFFCIGVYTGAVPREEFRKITVDFAVAFGEALIDKSPGGTLCLLSGAGADRTEKSKMMFAADKGAAENQLSSMGLKAFHTFRPGYIYPVASRKEPNFSYKLMRFLYKPLIRPLGKKYSIKSTELAQSMFNVGFNGCDLEILENQDILRFS